MTLIRIICRLRGFREHHASREQLEDQEPVNSERIRKEFGSFGIDVVECTRQRRISCLYSLENDLKVCRTHAAVEFNDRALPNLEREHALVLNGDAIGATFQAHGWSIIKRNTRIGSITLTADDRDIVAAMRVEPPQRVAIHSYVFEVQKGPLRCDYARITELHHPDYLSEADVLSIYGLRTSVAGAG